MKRITVVLLLLFILTACSVQEKVNPQIFIERVQNCDENITVENVFFEDDVFICFADYAQKANLVFEMATDEHENVKKINLACTQTDKAEEFIYCAESVVKTYAPEDDSAKVIKDLFSSKELSGKCIYYETQWHIYSAVLSENGLYFSSESKKLVPQSDVEFSLKENDIVTY